ncbi:MAG: radical SAM protein [Nitrospinae bacterium CG11_big_fil_rev_8_21_14_0_20_56_8]|nr:MAG: radical SAM protein [Nitrospinae bacterium CG11_big_fil_rev_8_21_14_0_20_56_8]
MKIVVANSVGVDRNGYHMVHVPSRWSLGVRNFTNCGYYPWELAYTSALLKRDTAHEVKFLDGVLEGWDFDAYFLRMDQEHPDWLIMESSSRTIREDLRLAAAVKKAFGTRLVFTGQHPMARPDEVLKVADYVCIGEYEFTVLSLIQGNDPATIPGVYPNGRSELLDVNRLPFPEDDDVRRIDYHEPNCRYRQIQMYASRGCPRRCNFCAAATLYYDELNWRPRNIESIVGEIRYLKEKYPEMEGVFFDEETHNIRKRFNIGLARAICEAGLDHLKYEAMSEYASYDEETLEAMRRAGYYKTRIGVETGSDRVAEQMTLGKKHDLAKLRRVLDFCRRIDMKVYATFSIGGLGSTPVEDRKTVDLIYDLSSRGLLQEVQVSINTPQPGTDYYQSCLENSLLDSGIPWDNFDGNGHVVVNIPGYSSDQILSRFQEALAAFDRGKRAAQAGAFMKGAVHSLNDLSPASRVLVLRSARMWFVDLILEALKEKGLNAEVLGQDAVRGEMEGHPSVNRFYSYGSGFFSPECLSPDLLGTLQAQNYDVILIPVANNHLDGYENAIDVARGIDPARILAIFPEGQVQPLLKPAPVGR